MTITIKPSNFAVSLRAADRRATTLLIKPYLPDIVATPKTDREFTVSIVDDDPGVLKSLARLVRAARFRQPSNSLRNTTRIFPAVLSLTC